jgi:hypothetical protein
VPEKLRITRYDAARITLPNAQGEKSRYCWGGYGRLLEPALRFNFYVGRLHELTSDFAQTSCKFLAMLGIAFGSASPLSTDRWSRLPAGRSRIVVDHLVSLFALRECGIS